MPNQQLAKVVSDQALPDLKELADLPPRLMTTVATALTEVAPSLTPLHLAESVSSSANLGITEVGPPIRIIRRIALLQRFLEKSAESFVAELTACLAALSDTQWPTEYREKWRSIAPELVRALSPTSAIYLSAKAHDLLGEQSLALCAARIITDMRPIFDDEAKEMEAVVPFHTLVLRCHESERSEHKMIHVAIDANDLQQIRKQVDRAERKEQLMRSKLASGGYTIIGVPASDKMEDE